MLLQYMKREIIFRGFDMLINCSVDISIKQNNTIAWIQFDPNVLISETFKYAINSTELIIHNITAEDEEEYACYSEEMAVVYQPIKKIYSIHTKMFHCKHILNPVKLNQLSLTSIIQCI